MKKQNLFYEKASLIISECDLVFKAIDSASIDKLICEIETAGKVFFIGVGRVMLSLQAISKRWNHLGIQSICVGQIDEPPITNKDLLIVGSSSGETIIPASIAKKAHDIGARLVYIGTNSTSTVRKISDVFINVPINRAGLSNLPITSRQPMTSLFEQSLLLMGDIIAMMIMERKGLCEEDVLKTHANLQ